MIPPNPIRTGGEIDTDCSRCNLNLAHTILAMVGQKVERVKCNTCGSEHKYKGSQPLLKTVSLAKPRAASSTSSTPRAAKPRASSSPVAFEDQFRGKDISHAKKYSPRETFAEDDVVDHPTFGMGVVAEVRVDKVDISFRAGIKTLVHGKGGVPADAQKPTFTHPTRGTGGAFADKVPVAEPAPVPAADEPSGS